MQHDDWSHLGEALLAGRVSLSEFAAAASAKETGAETALEGATLDLDRTRRCGFPEVVYAEGKPDDALLAATKRLLVHLGEVFLTRVSPQQYELLAFVGDERIYNPRARTLRITAADYIPPEAVGSVAVVTAGTSDLFVAEEAVETLRWMRVPVDLIADVGVAGPHRLAARRKELEARDAVVVVAGMEGALPSVVAGYVDCPVVGVPTSVGYGANLGGVAALLSMINSCASNVAVVNIDAGFRGGYLSGMIARRQGEASRESWGGPGCLQPGSGEVRQE